MATDSPRSGGDASGSAGPSSSDLFDPSSILPDDPRGDDGRPLDVLHDREYRVRAFRLTDDRVLLRGAIRDQKPPALYVDHDPDPLTVHHMQIDLEVSYPSMEIVAADVTMSTHPHPECPRIERDYDGLVGLSIARGFTHKVRELFGGPRGCTHTTALLQAMAPVAIQCIFSLYATTARHAEERGGTPAAADGGGSTDARPAAWQMNVNTCHVWAEDGEWVQRAAAGEQLPPPLWMEERLVTLGLKPDDWRSPFRD